MKADSFNIVTGVYIAYLILSSQMHLSRHKYTGFTPEDIGCFFAGRGQMPDIEKTQFSGHRFIINLAEFQVFFKRVF